MARDAIARQYDVDKNSMIYLCETDKGGYRPGKITFHAKKGRSLDLQKMRESIAATRLSGGTNMGMDYLEITATGEVKLDDKSIILKVSGTPQSFVLQDVKTKDGAKSPLQRLREELSGGAKVLSVTGRVDGWSGRFPVVLEGLAKRPADAPGVLYVLDFETSTK
jgi:hypothetical protein